MKILEKKSFLESTSSRYRRPGRGKHVGINNRQGTAIGLLNESQNLIRTLLVKPRPNPEDLGLNYSLQMLTST